MAVLALSALGAATGAAIGGTFLGVTAASWGWMAGSMLGNALFAKDAEGPRLGDLRVTGSEYGQPVPWVAGSPRIAGQIIWASQKRETATSESAKGGPEVTTYTYDCDLLILLAENGFDENSRVWLNSELVLANNITKSGVWSNIVFYNGSDDQLPDPTYEAAVGSGNAPAFRGRTTVAITGLQLGGGGQIPNLTFQRAGTLFANPQGTPSYLADLYLSALENNVISFNGFSVYGNNLYITGPSTSPFESERYVVDVSTGGYTYLGSSDNGENNQNILTYGFGVNDTVMGASGALTNGIRVSIGGTLVSYYRYDLQSYPYEDFSFSGRFCVTNSGIFLTKGSTGYPILKYRGHHIDSLGDTVAFTNSSLLNSSSKSSSGMPPIVLGDYVYIQSLTSGISDPGIYKFDLSLNFIETIPFPDLTGSTGQSLVYSTDDNILKISVYGASTRVIFAYFEGQWVIANNNAWPSDWTVDTAVAWIGNSAISTSYNVYSGPSSIGFKVAKSFVSNPDGPVTEPIDDVISKLMLRTGYSGSDYTTAVGNEKLLRGIALSQVSATRGALESLQTAWFFEASKSDKIYIRPRAETAVITIPWADLGCAADPATGEDALSLVLANDLEVPAQVALSYPSMEQDYQTATEHSDRIFSGQESTQTVQLGIGMTSAEAKGVADAIVFDLAASQTKATLRVPLKYAYVEPGDIVNAVNFDGRTYRLRVQTKRDTLSIIELECVLDDVGALQNASITDGDYISVTEPVTVEQTEFEALDIPILRDADNSPGYYMAVGPVITNPDNYEWKGAQVVRSWNGTDYAELFQTTGAGVLGTCSNTLGNWTGGNVYDETNTLTVVTTGGELSSRTREAMQLDGTLNVAAVGSQANGWEIIRFRNATLTGTNTYVLTGLHRGFRGTEWAMAGHGAGEHFVLLDSALRRVTTQTSQIGLLRYIKSATFGLRLADVPAENFTDTGVALKPFAPANPVALADGADVVLTWQRRTRVSYVYGGATPSVPVGENVESYRVRIFDGSTLVRTEVVLSPEYTYAAADISSDGFASSDTITFEICQISEIFGAGYPAECEGIAP